MISYLLNSLLIGILFAEMLERRFPVEFGIFVTDLSYNSLYLFSKMQINLSKIKNNVNNFINKTPILIMISNQFKSLITRKPGTIIMTQFIANGCLTSEGSYDFGIVSWLDEDNKCVNKKIIKDVYNFNEIIKSYEKSDIKFMLIEMKIGLKTYKVDLKTDIYNYYLVGNEFTKEFFIYYFKQILEIDEPINENNKFILNIIDHNVNTVQIDFSVNKTILLEKNGYRINPN